MSVITYTAQENIIAGHVQGQDYSIENEFQVIDDDSVEVGTLLEALGGDTEYELDRIRDLVSIRSDIVDEVDKLLWKEFLTSVADRSQFQIDFTGTILAPVLLQNCILETGRYRPVREQPGVQTYTFPFTVRIV